jgi:hypothetical protein
VASRSANTPTELWHKVINAAGDVKLAVAENGMQKYARDLTKAVEVETTILQHLGEPVEEMLGGFQAPSMGGASPFTPGAGGGGVAMAGGGAPMPGGPMGPGGAPNPDELRRALP